MMFSSGRAKMGASDRLLMRNRLTCSTLSSLAIRGDQDDNSSPRNGSTNRHRPAGFRRRQASWRTLSPLACPVVIHVLKLSRSAKGEAERRMGITIGFLLRSGVRSAKPI